MLTNCMLCMEKMIETRKHNQNHENSMNSMEKLMNTLGKSMNTMEKLSKTMEKMINSANNHIYFKIRQSTGFCSKM